MAKSVGDQELALLTYVAEVGGATVGEVAEGFGVPRGLARSTVLTMMERLRQKGHLTRTVVHGVYRYSPRASTRQVVREKVRGFVAQTLGGSVAPFVSYLSEEADVSESDLAELEDLVARLQARRKKGAKP